jgi:hypothetical protein
MGGPDTVDSAPHRFNLILSGKKYSAPKFYQPIFIFGDGESQYLWMDII